jgi:hypothetical protein
MTVMRPNMELLERVHWMSTSQGGTPLAFAVTM